VTCHVKAIMSVEQRRLDGTGLTWHLKASPGGGDGALKLLQACLQELEKHHSQSSHTDLIIGAAVVSGTGRRRC
jgi:hypothetical protein